MYYGEKYVLNKQDKIIIYGAATTGALIYRNLEAFGFNVVAFIDKRSNEIDSYYSLPVWNLSQAKECFEDNTESIIIIGIKNVFEHEKIAKNLWKIGCRRIIFRPYNVVVGYGKAKDRVLNKTYDCIIAGEFPKKSYEIKGFEERILKDNAVIEEEEDYVIANIPAYYVFTDNYEDKSVLWGDIPCLGLVPHIGLFDFFLGNDNEDYQEYIKFCKDAALRSGGIVTSKAWEDSVYNNRLDVFNHMQYAWEHNRDFFVKNAVEAVYNDKGYFNICSGKHRIVYMLVKGSHYIPLKIKKTDYYKWNSENKALALSDVLSELDMDSIPFVLGFPHFYDYPCSSSDFYSNTLIGLIKFIFKKTYYETNEFIFDNYKVLFYNTPLAVYADVFKMLGFHVDIFEDNLKMIDLLNVILEGSVYTINRKIESDNEYFLVIMNDELQLDKVLEVAIKYKLYISNERSDKGQLLASGLVEGEFLFAFIKAESLRKG